MERTVGDIEGSLAGTSEELARLVAAGTQVSRRLDEMQISLTDTLTERR